MVAYTPRTNPNKLLQLSDEVNRIATTLARLSCVPNPTEDKSSSSQSHAPNISADTVRSVISARRARTRYFAADLFADPSWDILLDLFAAELSQTRVSVSSACIAANVPATTALRWIRRLVEEGLIIRHNDPFDGRRVFLELASETSLALRQYFAQIGRPLTI